MRLLGVRAAVAAPMVVAMLAALAATAPSPAAAARAAEPGVPDPFGINNGVLWPDGNKLLDTGRHVRAIGETALGSVRAIPYWNLLEPQAPHPRTGERTFDWTRTDAMAEHLAGSGLRWDAILGFSSPWGGTLLGTTAGAPRIGPFAQYASAVARRYGREGEFWENHPELPYVPIVSYQVWNEPNVPVGLTVLEPDYYAELYLATREAVLEVDPHARVAIGGLVHSAPSGSGNAGPYLRAMFAARPDLAGNVDALGITVYRRTPEQVLDQIAQARAVLDDLGERDTPIDLLETGWTTSGALPFSDITPVSEEERGRLLTELVERLVAADCGLGTVTPFAWVTGEDIGADPSAWFGLSDRRTAEVKPSGGAYLAAVRRARDPGPPAAGEAVCDRPDLPRLLEDRRRVSDREPFEARIVRACSRKRYSVRWNLGPEAEPYARFDITLSSGTKRVVRDPDEGGPRTAPTRRTYGIPRRKGKVRVVARDALGRVRARDDAVLRKCPPRRDRDDR